MSVERAQVAIYRCDAPGCRAVHYREAGDDEPPPGYHGSVTWVHEGGGDGGKWYACSAGHINAAVLTAAERRD